MGALAREIAADDLPGYQTAGNVLDSRRSLELTVRKGLQETGLVVLTERVVQMPAHWRLEILSEGEAARCRAYAFPRDRWLSAAAHSLKRIALSAATGGPASDMRFVPAPGRRPFLAGASHDLDFNLSHSGQQVALAISRIGRIGIDVEQPGARYAHLLDMIRHPEERDQFANSADFLRLWTLKEAVSKAIGTGLAEGFATLLMTASTNDAEEGSYECNGWHCRHQCLDDGYHLAIASLRANAGLSPVKVTLG